MRQLWLVRAGANGEREVQAIEQSKLYPGFVEVRDLASMKDRESILEILRTDLSGQKANTLKNFSAQLNSFVNRMKVNDYVVMPRKRTDGVAIGVVTGEYEFDEETAFKHSRAVEWKAESLSRDTFKQDLRHSFGAFMTICEIKRNSALERVESALNTGKDLGPLLNERGRIPNTMEPGEEEDESDASDYQADIEELANQQIISLIKSEFAGHGLAELVAEIMTAEGYTTKVSPPGADGGVDILAAGGSLGLGEDRICVQVKSGDGAANHDVVLRLIGSVSNTQAQTGLLVSIGGVNTPAKKELDKNFFKIRLWEMSDLLKALFRTYPKLSDETRGKLILKQVYAPVARDIS